MNFIRTSRSMKIIIASATDFEIATAKEKILQQNNKHEILFLTTGIGMLPTAVNLMNTVFEQKPDLIIQAGIAGTFDENFVEKVAVIKDEILGDAGVEEDNKWKDIFDLKLEDENNFPFENKKLINHSVDKWNVLKLPAVNAISVNEISTKSARIKLLKEKYQAISESMEGAALHYVCTKMNVEFLQLRSFSNIVGERDKTKWKMKEAVECLNETLIELIIKF